MADALKGPLIRSLPLWRGQDTNFVINRFNGRDGSGNPIYLDFPVGTTARIIIDSKPVVAEEAVIVGHQATFAVPHDLTDNTKKDTLWRVQFTIDGRDKAPVAGKVVRKGET